MACGLYLQLVFVIMAMALGVWYLRQPQRVIETQKAVYRLFNWNLEPISMTKEIRNTRIMGAAVIILGIITMIYIMLEKAGLRIN